MTDGTNAATLEAKLGQKLEAMFGLQSEISELKKQWAAASVATVEDYNFQTTEGERKLSELFGDFSYTAPFVVLLLCGIGLPLPEEVTLIASGLLLHQGECSRHLHPICRRLK